MRVTVLLLLVLIPNSSVARERSVRRPAAERILWIGAHPDDEALIAPLLGRSCVEAAEICSLLVFTRGERGDCLLKTGCGGDLGSVRANEMARVADLFHSRLTLWTFPDINVDVDAAWSAEAGGHEALVGRIVAAIAAENPTVIYTFDPNHGSTCHPAHRATGALVLESVAGMGSTAPRVVLVETAVAFVGNGFEFSSAIADAQAIDSRSSWDYLVRDVEAHPSQFTPEQVDSLRNISYDQRRVYTLPAPPQDPSAYILRCF